MNRYILTTILLFFIFLSVIYTEQYFPRTLQSPITAHTTGILHFNEGGGLKTADTSSWGGLATLPAGVAWTAGRYGTGLNFSFETTPTIVVSTSNSGQLHFEHTDKFGYYAWIKTSGGTARNFVVGGDTGQNNDGLWQGSSLWVWDSVNDTVGFGMSSIKTGGGYRYYKSAIVVTDGLWHFICAVSTGYTDNCLIYVDGTFDVVTYLYVSGDIISIINDFSAPMIGGRYFPANWYDTRYEGVIDEFGFLKFPSSFGESEIKNCIRILYEEKFNARTPR